MSNIIGKYKGYIGSFEYDNRSNTVWGKLLFIRDLITFESLDGTPKSLKEQFELAVDEYLADCQEDGTEPEQPAKGSFNVRIPHELHMDALLYARKHDTSLNNVVKNALEEKFTANGVHIHHHQDHTHLYQDSSSADHVIAAKEAMVNAKKTFYQKSKSENDSWVQ